MNQRAGWMIFAASVLAMTALVGWLAAERMAQRAGAESPTCVLPSLPAQHPYQGMVWVPAGLAEIGDRVYAEEMPLRRVQVEGFWMDRTEVTNTEFAVFVAATGYITVAERQLDATRQASPSPEMLQAGVAVFKAPAELQGGADLTQWWKFVPGANWRHPGGSGTSIDGRGSHPVVGVTIEDAWAYARWKGRVLPTEAQWEWAARGARPEPVQSRDQPKQANTWQGFFPVVNTASDGFVGVAPVGCYEPNALGLYDMVGNVWELTADPWSDHPGGLSASSVQTARGASATHAAQHVIKGGSFLCAPTYCMRYRPGARQPQETDLATTHVGFRTILNAPKP